MPSFVPCLPACLFSRKDVLRTLSLHPAALSGSVQAPFLLDLSDIPTLLNLLLTRTQPRVPTSLGLLASRVHSVGLLDTNSP